MDVHQTVDEVLAELGENLKPGVWISTFTPDELGDATLALPARSLPVDDAMTLAVVGPRLSGAPRNGELLDRGARDITAGGGWRNHRLGGTH